MLISNLKLSKSKSTENLLKKLLKLGIGTPEVEKFSSICAGQSIGKKYDRSLVLFAMKKKVEDAEWATRQAKHEFFMRKAEYQQVIRRNTFIDIEFQREQ